VIYPRWSYFPRHEAPPSWVLDFVNVVEKARPGIDSSNVEHLTSDRVLAQLRPGLEELDHLVESSKKAADKIRRPVLFGDEGIVRVAYEVDAVNDDLGVLVEIEAGRGAMGNAVYRDLIRSSLIVGARYFVLGVMAEYHYAGGVTQSFRDAKGLLDAIYSSGRLVFPFEGILLIGY
jgi:hypothetical protein